MNLVARVPTPGHSERLHGATNRPLCGPDAGSERGPARKGTLAERDQGASQGTAPPAPLQERPHEGAHERYSAARSQEVVYEEWDRSDGQWRLQTKERQSRQSDDP